MLVLGGRLKSVTAVAWLWPGQIQACVFQSLDSARHVESLGTRGRLEMFPGILLSAIHRTHVGA